MSEEDTWYILGAGAMGTLIAGSLSAAGIPCQMLTHHPTPEAREWVHAGRRVSLSVTPIRELAAGTVHRLLLATKAHTVRDALALSIPAQAPGAPVIACANGMGFERECEALLGGRPLLRAISTEAALRSDPRTVRHTGEGVTLFGGQRSCDENRSMATAEPTWFSGSLGQISHWRWDADIGSAVRGKFALNCAINALTALHGCRNGELLERSSLREELRALCEETQDVMVSLGLWAGGESLTQQAVRVCTLTSANRSSMLQDRLARRRTELDYLNGHLVRLATENHIEAPLNAALVATLNDQVNGETEQPRAQP